MKRKQKEDALRERGGVEKRISPSDPDRTAGEENVIEDS